MNLSSNKLFDLDIWIPSNRPNLAYDAQKSLLPYNAKIFNGDGYDSFSKLVNHCIVKSENEIIVIVNDKARANSSHINKIVTLLESGYGLVGLYRFGFFGFKKELIRKIGFMDERFVGGGYEDDDFFLRIMEANIAYYESEEIPYIQMFTSWKHVYSMQYFPKKWHIGTDRITRLLSEENYNYSIGDSNNIKYNDFSHSIIMRQLYIDFSKKFF